MLGQERIQRFTDSAPLFLPGVAISVVLALAFAPLVARWLVTRPLVAFLMLVSLGTILAATLTPGAEALAEGIVDGGGCDLSRFGPAPLSELTRISETSLNILLFVPLGIAVGALPLSRRSTATLLATLLLPFVVEATQALVESLGRVCESEDVFDNLTGLVIGLLIAGGTRGVAGSRLTRPSAARILARDHRAPDARDRARTSPDDPQA